MHTEWRSIKWTINGTSLQWKAMQYGHFTKIELLKVHVYNGKQ
jgi:hypothetical protein